jgi:hypothetical protein
MDKIFVSVRFSWHRGTCLGKIVAIHRKFKELGVVHQLNVIFGTRYHAQAGNEQK